MRCFVGSFLSEQGGMELEKLTRPALTNVRWLARGKYHVTLQFLGEIDDAEVERQQRIVAAASDHFPVDCTVRAVTGFPRRGAARVVVALVESNGKLERAAAECGADRFRAHVTLARCRGRAALPDYGSVNVAFRLGSVGLYRSLAGARYTLVG